MLIIIIVIIGRFDAAQITKLFLGQKCRNVKTFVKCKKINVNDK